MLATAALLAALALTLRAGRTGLAGRAGHERLRLGLDLGGLADPVGAVLTGAIAQIASGSSIGDTDIVTALVAIPGTLVGLAAIYALGVSREEALES